MYQVIAGNKLEGQESRTALTNSTYGFASILKLFWLYARLIGQAPVDNSSAVVPMWLVAAEVEGRGLAGSWQMGVFVTIIGFVHTAQKARDHATAGEEWLGGSGPERNLEAWSR